MDYDPAVPKRRADVEYGAEDGEPNATASGASGSNVGAKIDRQIAEHIAASDAFVARYGALADEFHEL